MSVLIKQLCVAISTLFAITSLLGCTVKPAIIDDGNVKIRAAPLNGKIARPLPWTDGWTVKAISNDGHSAIANLVNESLKKGGYNFVDGDTRLTYTITEIYAGRADKYNQPHTEAGNIITSGASVALAVGVCALLNSCSTPGLFGNNLSSSVAPNSDPVKNANAGADVDLAEVNLVVYSICVNGGGCASSAAMSTDQSVTLDDLRKANATLGLPRSMHLGE